MLWWLKIKKVVWISEILQGHMTISDFEVETPSRTHQQTHQHKQGTTTTMGPLPAQAQQRQDDEQR